MRVVLDTNTVVSGLLWLGSPKQLIVLVEQETITLYTSPELLAELQEVLMRPKFAKRLTVMSLTAQALFDHYSDLVTIVDVPAPTSPITADPDDDLVIACAVAVRADYIVSGDHHLLDLSEYRGVKILNAAQFWAECRLSTNI